MASTTSVGMPSIGTYDVVGAAGQAGQRRGGAGEAVGRLVDGAVAAEGHDDVVALVRGLAAQLGRVARGPAVSTASTS